ncbi:MAG: hypothetical protein UHM85_09775 [Acutalibacteraceae bacterium]|nr:hypothetical protein [Acutalibacteraceae bacterium]
MKKKILTLSAVLLLFITFVFTASASGFKEFKTKSTFVPVTYSSHKSTSSVTLYGNADYLCMKAYSETSNSEYFCIEIYSDSKRSKKILEYANTFKKGTTYEDILFDLTSLKSKTYYATSYVIKQSNRYPDYRLVKDPATVRNFTIIVKRDGTSIKNMKSFMYGYENTYYGPAIYWYSVPGATKYEVYKYVDKKYKKIATVKANGEDFSYYIDKSLKGKNTSAYYKVKALNGTGSTALSLNKVKAITLKTPTVKTELLTKGIKVSWSKPRSSCTYVVLRSTNGGDWKQIKETKSTKYTDTEVTTGKTYYYTVVAYYKGTASGYDPEVEGRYYISAPTLDSVKPADGKLNFKWKSIKKAESYNVYRKASGEKSWTKLANVKTAEYTDASIQRNKVYSYTVSAVIGKKQGLYNTKGVSGAVIDTPVLNEIERTADGYAKISWNKIDGVSYKVYRKTAESGWEHIKSTSSTEYIDNTDLINGNEYYYTVKAYIGSKEGAFDKTGKGFVYFEPVKIYSVGTVTGGVELNWSLVEGATEYIIYRKAADGEFVRLASCSKERYFDETAEKEVNYEYKITYVLNSVEQTAFPSYKSCMISADTIALADEGAAELIDFSHAFGWRIRIKGYNSDATYSVYEKTENGLRNVDVSKEPDAFIIKCNRNSGFNFIITEVKKDGTIRMSPPEGFTFEIVPVCKTIIQSQDNKKGEVTLTWTPVEGADKYYIYKEEKLIKIYDTVSVYTETGLKPDSYINYRVCAVKGYSVGAYESQDVWIPGIPKIKSVKVNTSGLLIKWCEDETCNLYRKAEGENEWKLIKSNILYGSYLDSTVKSGKTYYYTLAQVGGHGREGRYNEKGVKATYLAPATIKSVDYYTSSLRITWNKVSGAKYYKVYRKVDSTASSKFKLVYTTENAKTVKYTDKNVKPADRYIYYVKAYSSDVTSAVENKTVFFLAPPKNLAAKKVDSGVKITFDKVAGASKLYIYRKSGSGSWEKIGSAKSSATSYTDKTAKKGVKYYYYVKSYNKYYKQYSYKSSTVSCKR